MFPDEALMQAWSDEFGNVYRSEFEDDVVIYWRPLGRHEIRQVLMVDNEEELEKEEMICTMGALWPVEFDFANCDQPNLPSELAHDIMQASYFDPQARDELLEQLTEDMNYQEPQMDVMIHEVFPEYTLEQIMAWPYERTFFFFVRAKWVLESLRSVVFEPLDPKKAKSKVEPPRRTAVPEELRNDPDYWKNILPEIPWDEDETIKRQRIREQGPSITEEQKQRMAYLEQEMKKNNLL